jgi:hypothetical protein
VAYRNQKPAFAQPEQNIQKLQVGRQPKTGCLFNIHFFKPFAFFTSSLLFCENIY